MRCFTVVIYKGTLELKTRRHKIEDYPLRFAKGLDRLPQSTRRLNY